MLKDRFLPFLGVALVVLASPCFGLSVQFPNPVFFPEKAMVRRNMFVTNTEDKMVALEITVVQRVDELDGGETHTDASTSFLIYPSQILLGAAEDQIVTIEYVGEARLVREKAYRVIVTQVPITIGDTVEMNEEGAKGQVKLIYKILKSCYVQPVNAVPDLSVSELKKIGTKGARKLQFTIENVGGKHVVLKDATLRFVPKNGKGEHLVAASDVINGVNYLAGGRRRFSMQWPSKFRLDGYSASIEYPR